MTRRTRAVGRTALLVCLVVGALADVVPGRAGGGLVVDGPADPQASAQTYSAAQTVPPTGAVDVVSIAQRGKLSSATITTAQNAAAASGATAVVGRGFQVGLRRVVRGNTVVQQSSGDGWGFPMSVTALPLDAFRAVMGRDLAGTLAHGQLVMAESSATMRGAQVGDRVDLLNNFGLISSYSIGRIAPDDDIGGSEFLMTVDMATDLGVTTNTRVLIYGPFARPTLDFMLTYGGLLGNPSVQVWHSWDAPGADGPLSLLQTKLVMGEFDLYYAGLATSTWVLRNEDWTTAHLPATREPYPTGIVARCHNVIRADLYAALDEINTLYPELINTNSDPASQSTGLDIANTNSSGGCATPHTARLSRTGISTGIVSRHSWGMALDTSTAANCQGCIPVMDCRIVRIFRKHNFTWGGSYLTPDGMHIEWVGERRDQVPNPSSPCPNLIPPPPETANSPPRRSDISTLFADDGWMGEE